MNIVKLIIGRLKPHERDDFEEILNKSREATIFHTLDWNKILVETFNAKVIIFLAKDDIKPLCSFISCEYQNSGPRTIYYSPNRSLETVYGGPLAVSGTNDNGTNYKKEFFKELHLKSKAAIIEVWLPHDAKTEFLKEMGYSIYPYSTSIVNLEQNDEDLWRNIHPKTRNQIRKAQKSKVQIIKDGIPYLPKYYEMIKDTLGSKNVKVLPKGFYQRVMENLEPKNMAKLFIAKYDGKVIAGAIFLFYRDTVYYWHGASFKEYSSVCPNNLIQWELIRYSRQNGYKKYDLLSIEPDRLPGIARFKMRFGGETKTYYRAFWKTPFYRLSLIKYYIKYPSYLYRRIRTRLEKAKSTQI